MSESQIQAALAAFEAKFGEVDEAEGCVAEMKSGCIGVCDTGKCVFAD